MTDVAHPLSQRFEPLPRHDFAWVLPLALALALVASVAIWLQLSDSRDREIAQQLLISDTLSLERQLRTRIGVEQERLAELAQLVGGGRIPSSRFGGADEVIGGMRRHWISILWLDEAGRIVAQAPADFVEAVRDNPETRGLTAHLETPIVDYEGESRGRLVVRYALASLLEQETPPWIAQRHTVRLVDGFGEQLATTSIFGGRPTGERHRVSFSPPFLDVYLELQQRRAFVPWYRTTPLALVMGVLALLSWATYLTWRQTRKVARAQAAWHGEVAWRRAIEDALTVGLRARDIDGRLLYVNRRLCELTGFSEAELVGCMPPMPYWPPDEIEEVMQRHLRNMAGGAPAMGYESRWRTKDGRDIIVMLFEAPLIDPKGKQVGWLGSVVDVTGLRRAEELEQRRAERAADQARLMVLGEIAASLAHELNQPLTAIASYSAGVRNALKSVPGIEPRVMAALEKQGEQVARVGRIVERIRGFMSRRAPQREHCDLRRIANNAAELVRSNLKRRGIELNMASQDADEATPAPAVIEAFVDPVLIEQVIINLVLNAADALQAIEGADASRNISIDVGGTREQVWVDVADNGPGLQGRSLSQMSTPFYSTKAKGMGLGLSICRSIIEAHLGELSACDAPGGGALFRFTLPRSVPVQPDVPMDVQGKRAA